MTHLDWQIKIRDFLTSLTMSRDEIEALMDLKIAHIPKRLFKCRGFTDNAINNFTEQTLFCAHPDTFNDPYECSLQANISATVNFGDLLKDAAVELNSAELEAMTNMLESRCEKMSNEVSTAFKNRMANIYKICALSERVDSIVMWSHYAANHKGFAMEYDFHDLPRTDTLVRSLWPVIYDPDMLDLSALIISDERPKAFNSLFAIAAAIHKTEDWRYEKEWRLLIHSQAPLNVPAPLKAVYIGARASEKDRNALIEAANLAGVPVFQMRLAERRFEMTYDPA